MQQKRIHEWTIDIGGKRVRGSIRLEDSCLLVVGYLNDFGSGCHDNTESKLHTQPSSSSIPSGNEAFILQQASSDRYPYARVRFASGSRPTTSFSMPAMGITGSSSDAQHVRSATQSVSLLIGERCFHCFTQHKCTMHQCHNAHASSRLIRKFVSIANCLRCALFLHVEILRLSWLLRDQALNTGHSRDALFADECRGGTKCRSAQESDCFRNDLIAFGLLRQVSLSIDSNH